MITADRAFAVMEDIFLKVLLCVFVTAIDNLQYIAMFRYF